MEDFARPLPTRPAVDQTDAFANDKGYEEDEYRPDRKLRLPSAPCPRAKTVRTQSSAPLSASNTRRDHMKLCVALVAASLCAFALTPASAGTQTGIIQGI